MRPPPKVLPVFGSRKIGKYLNLLHEDVTPLKSSFFVTSNGIYASLNKSSAEPFFLAALKINHSKIFDISFRYDFV